MVIKYCTRCAIFIQTDIGFICVQKRSFSDEVRLPPYIDEGLLFQVGTIFGVGEGPRTLNTLIHRYLGVDFIVPIFCYKFHIPGEWFL
jgi:hypothetical protein